METFQTIITRILRPKTIYSLMFYGTLLGLCWYKINPPQELWNMVNLILGFHFGYKTAKSINKEK